MITEWLHNPTHREKGDRLSQDGGVWYHHRVTGWATTTVWEDVPICGLPYPEPTLASGSCGADPGHEHPHVWVKRGYHVQSVTRRVRVGVKV